MKSRVLMSAALCLAACAHGAFSPHAEDNDAQAVKTALLLATDSHPPTQPLAVVLLQTERDTELAAVRLDDGQILWQKPANVHSRIALSDRAAICVEGEGANAYLVAHRLDTGEKLWSHHLAKGTFSGFAVDGDDTAYVNLEAAGATLVALKGGSVNWRRSTNLELGAPAIKGHLVVVPFAHQSLSLFNFDNGVEVARIRTTEEQLSYVRALPDAFYYGGKNGIYRLDERSATGQQRTSTYLPLAAMRATASLQPSIYVDGYNLTQASYSAFDRNRFVWWVRDAMIDPVVLHAARYLFAFAKDATGSPKARWVYAHPRVDIVSAETNGDVLAFVAGDGQVGLVDTHGGASRIVATLPSHAIGGAFSLANLAPNFSATSAQVASEQARTLSQIVWDPDARFNMQKTFAVEALAQLPGALSGAPLVKIITAKSSPRADARAHEVPLVVQKQAAAVLVNRVDAADVAPIADALKIHTDYLKDVEANGVGVLAAALAHLASAPEGAAARASLEATVPLLTAQLFDPETPQNELQDVARALGAIAHLRGPHANDALSALKRFLLAYRCDSQFLTDGTGLVAIGKALQLLAKDGNVDAKRTLDFVLREPRTLKPVVDAIEAPATDK